MEKIDQEKSSSEDRCSSSRSKRNNSNTEKEKGCYTLEEEYDLLMGSRGIKGNLTISELEESVDLAVRMLMGPDGGRSRWQEICRLIYPHLFI